MKNKILITLMIGLILVNIVFVSASFGYNNRDLIIIRTLNDTLDPLWSGNYTNMLTVCPTGNYSYGIFENGTWKCRSDLSGAGGEVDPKWSANYTVCAAGNHLYFNGRSLACEADDDTTYSDLSEFNDDLGNRGYTHLTNFTDDILWTSTFNTTGDTRWLTSFTELDPKWSANFTNMVTDCPGGNYSYGMYDNGTWKCRSDVSGAGAETDPYWTANYSLYNDTWSANTWDTTWVANWSAYNTTWGTDTTYSQGTNMTFDGTTINWDGSWVSSIFAKIVDLLDYIKWVDIWAQVYNETEVDAINTSMQNYVNNQDTTYNDSISAYVNSEDTRFNDSMKTYVDNEFVSTEVDPKWTANWTNVAFTNTEEVFSGNITVEGIKLEVDSTNHRIYDNATCIIITGDTSELRIC